MHCVYKPVAGERPLWDFPDGTLAGRELAAYLVSQALGWNIVPHTIIRDGPAGRGMLQQWVDQPGEARSATQTRAGVPALDLVDLCPAGRVPPGYLSVLQAYDFAGDEVMLIHADDIRLRRMAVFDVLVNNADRKGGHVLRGWTAACTASTTDCACTSRTNCAPCYGAGPASPSTTTRWRSVAALADALDDDTYRRLTALITPTGGQGPAPPCTRVAGAPR